MFDSEKKHLFAPAWFAPAILLCAGLLFFFAHLERGHLPGESEGNYAEIPREMLESGEWTIPHLNYVPYLEKPPLFYWLTAATYKVLGPCAFSARLWSALPALLLVISVYGFVRGQRGAEEAFLSALLLASSGGMIAMARISYMDMLLCLCTAWTFLGFYLGECATESNKHRAWFLSAFVALALAVLTKGLIGIALPGAGIFFYLALQKRWFVLCRVPWLLGLTLFLAIALPWHLFAAVKNERFAWFYFVNEHWLRFLGKRMPKDYYGGAFHYQFLRMLLLFLPWSPLLPLLFLKNVRARLRDPWHCFLFCWVAAFLLFYTVSKAKANYYMMPALPAMAMLLGSGIREHVWERWKGCAWQGLMGAYLLAALAIYGWLSFYPYPLLKKLAPGSFPYFFIADGALAIALSGAFLLSLRRRWKASLLCAIAGMAIGCYTVFAQDQIFEKRGSIRPLERLLAANADAETMLVMRGAYEKESALAFYHGKRFFIVSDQGDVGGDLDFGSRFPEHRPYFLQWPEFLRRFGGKEKILYITSREADYGELRGNHGGKCRLISRVAYRLLIANFPPKAMR